MNITEVAENSHWSSSTVSTFERVLYSL